jgi:hypothetical protein
LVEKIVIPEADESHSSLKLVHSAVVVHGVHQLFHIDVETTTFKFVPIYCVSFSIQVVGGFESVWFSMCWRTF